MRESPFARNLQPPLLQQDESFNGRAVDSYGNPIDALRPIDTPDGRKVVSAQGVQFEIPTYASGITEIRRPADDLLPPHIGELAGNDGTNEGLQKQRPGTETSTDTPLTPLTSSSPSNSNPSSRNSTRTALAAPPPIAPTNSKLAKRDSQGGQFPIAPPSNHHVPPPFP